MTLVFQTITEFQKAFMYKLYFKNVKNADKLILELL